MDKEESGSPRFALVIQGPLISEGKDGKAFSREGTGKVIKEEIVRHDCRDEIQSTISKYRYLFDDRIVISTWNDGVPFTVEGATILRLDDEGNDAGRRRGDTQLRYNIFRSYRSAKAGVDEAVRKFSPDYIIRIRSDQSLDLSSISKAIESEDPKYLWAPGCYRADFGLMDFYFAGSTSAMVDFHDSLLPRDLRIFCSRNVHLDIPLKMIFAEADSDDFPYCFPIRSRIDSFPNRTAELIDKLYDQKVRLLGIEVIKSLRWRGSSVVPDLIDRKAQNTHSFDHKLSVRAAPHSSKGLMAAIAGINWHLFYEAIQRLDHKESIKDYQLILSKAFKLLVRIRSFYRPSKH
ncbi:hypothetical protein WJT74_05535 [Sphingomicrobium sp. XHP0239]|uniref:hypothetical protein n=1 Tax=Sphingomicrobium maritimum TaxID=3133972 RepID=UPI0031CC54D6